MTDDAKTQCPDCGRMSVSYTVSEFEPDSYSCSSRGDCGFHFYVNSNKPTDVKRREDWEEVNRPEFVWPKHANGTLKSVEEMSQEERDEASERSGVDFDFMMGKPAAQKAAMNILCTSDEKQTDAAFHAEMLSLDAALQRPDIFEVRETPSSLRLVVNNDDET